MQIQLHGYYDMAPNPGSKEVWNYGNIFVYDVLPAKNPKTYRVFALVGNVHKYVTTISENDFKTKYGGKFERLYDRLRKRNLARVANARDRFKKMTDLCDTIEALWK